ncbi:MAG: M42 family peptidase [Planctomycetia bacterium]
MPPLTDESSAFLRSLLETPSPSGYEQPVQALVRAFAGRYADQVDTDLHGNVVAVLNPGGSPRILLDGHADQIGFMVHHVDDNGFVYFLPIGGWDMQILLGQSVVIWSAAGPVPGVVSRKATHLLSDAERKAVPEVHTLWIDVGAKDKEAALALTAVGDPVTLRLGMTPLQRDLICGPKMDDATGVFVVFEALRRLAARRAAGLFATGPSSPAVYFVSAVQEEIGLRGAQTAAYRVDPHVGIAVDVTHATDAPGIDKREHGDVKLGAGPVVFRGPNVNPMVFQLLRGRAAAAELPTQVKSANRGTANDANVLQLTRAGVAVGCLGLPLRYMHSPVEVVSLADLDVAAELLVEFVAAVGPTTDFTPSLAVR